MVIRRALFMQDLCIDYMKFLHIFAPRFQDIGIWLESRSYSKVSSSAS